MSLKSRIYFVWFSLTQIIRCCFKRFANCKFLPQTDILPFLRLRNYLNPHSHCHAVSSSHTLLLYFCSVFSTINHVAQSLWNENKSLLSDSHLSWLSETSGVSLLRLYVFCLFRMFSEDFQIILLNCHMLFCILIVWNEGVKSWQTHLSKACLLKKM